MNDVLISVSSAISPPMGVWPIEYIDKANICEDIPCVLCCEDHRYHVAQLVAPYKGVNDDGDYYCRHVYTTRHGACFHWNRDGSLHFRRVNGSGEHRYSNGRVVRFRPGEDMMDLPAVRVPQFLYEGDKYGQHANYHEKLFQLTHPFSPFWLHIAEL